MKIGVLLKISVLPSLTRLRKELESGGKVRTERLVF
jgi:hypothetical protein